MKDYKNPEDFRKSLEQKIQNISLKLNQDLERIRRKLAFERFLARLFYEKSASWLLKGGYAMELRFDMARATKDIDLMVFDFKQFVNQDVNKQLLEALREDSSRDLKDYFEFFINEATKELELPIYGGARFLVESFVGGRKFVKFNVDVGLGDVSIEPIENRKYEGLLNEFGFDPVQYKLINPEQQFAEKIHAYTLPRNDNKNSRVKDIIDIFMLIESDLIDKKLLAKSIKKVFERRKTHHIPKKLDMFPDEWKKSFEYLAISCGINSKIEDVYKILAEYYISIINEC